MMPELRKELILGMLEETGVVHTREVMQQCSVSELTIRRDLIELESGGMLIRTHGGAVKSKTVDTLFNYGMKISRNRQNKEAICRLAAGYIEEGDIIFIDCGTTLSLFAKYMTKIKKLTVITTSLPVISELVRFPNVRLSLIGGEIDTERQAAYGSVAEETVGMYHAGKAFIGADGISLKKGLSSYDEKEGAITRMMMENSDEVFLLCDSSKIEKNSFVRFASIDKINHLITDRQISPEHLKMYRDAGVDVTVEPNGEDSQNLQFNSNHKQS
jgi:DeoR family fructose operon transcriptional repressor